LLNFDGEVGDGYSPPALETMSGFFMSRLDCTRILVFLQTNGEKKQSDQEISDYSPYASGGG
jgi:hypothetical protein